MRGVLLCLVGMLVGCGSELGTWCSEVSECSAMTVDDCLAAEEPEVANAENWGCEEQYEAYLVCRNNTSVCANSVFTPDPVDACNQASITYNACLADAAGNQ